METVPSTVSWPPNQLCFALNNFLKNVYHWLSRVVEENKYLFHSFCDYKTNYLKKFPQNFQKSYTSFRVPRPSIPFNNGIPSALNRRPMYNLSATFVGDKAIEKSANIDQGQGDCIYILAIFWNCKMVFRFWMFQRDLKSHCVDLI